MANYVNKDNSFYQADTIARECPNCGAHAQLVPLATPSFADLAETRPRHAGVVFRCAACNEPRFGKLAVRSFGPERIELSTSILEVERAKERFQFGYLPRHVEPLFREALDCYTANCPNAFASMCRRTLQATSADFGRQTHLRWHEHFKDVVALAEVDAATTQTMEAVLFGADGSMPEVTREEAAVLIELIKDMLYQCYVRTSKLRAAMRMRRHFAGESDLKVASLEGRNRRLESA